MKMPDAYTLAKAFAEEISQALTPEQFDAVNERNASETNPNICHSHDYCDANQAMLDACDKLDFHYQPDINDDHGWLFNQAWAIARGAEFSVSQIIRDEQQMNSRV